MTAPGRALHGHDTIEPLRRWRVWYRTGLGDGDTRTTVVKARTTDEARRVARVEAEENGIPFLATVSTPRRMKLGIDEAEDRLTSARLLTDNVVSLASKAASDLVQSFDLAGCELHLMRALDDLKQARRFYRMADEEV